MLDTDAEAFGGTDWMQGRPEPRIEDGSLVLQLPPMSTLFLVAAADAAATDSPV
jgi:1,4-alpha-glucan branching enzyme